MTHSTQAYRLAVIVALGGFLFGFDASVISGAANYIGADFNLTDWQLGMVVAAPTLGGIIAGALAGPLSDRFGRRPMLQLIACLYLVSAIMSALAPDYLTITTARFIGGLAFASLYLAPIYIAEIAPPAIRGRMVSVNQFNIVIGFSAAYFANYAILNLSQSGQAWVHYIGLAQNTWRWMLGLEIVPALLYAALMMTVPESPRWLVLNNKRDKARNVLAKLLPNSDPDTEVANLIASQHSHLEPILIRLKKLFSSKVRLAFMIGLIIGVAQQITGINVVFFYAPMIFEQSGVGTNAAFVQAVWVGLINVAFTIIAMVMVDRIGRRPLLIMGLVGICISMAICSYAFKQSDFVLNDVAAIEIDDEDIKSRLSAIEGVVYNNDVAFRAELRTILTEGELRAHQGQIIMAATEINHRLVLFGILLFVASFAASLGPVMWILLSEIFPNALRGVGMAIIGVFNSSVSFLVQFIFPWQVSTIGISMTFFGYGACALVSLVLVYWLLPETKGQSLEQLEVSMTRSKDI